MHVYGFIQSCLCATLSDKFEISSVYLEDT
jgi:hypothetical protein